MMRVFLGLAALALLVAGCNLASQLGGEIDWQDLLGPDDAGRPLPEVLRGEIRVKLVNEAGADAEVRITMRVAGQRVHFALRNVASGEESLIIGPDEADSVLVEVLRIAGVDVARPILTFFLNVDYQSGDTVVVRITPEPIEPPPAEPNEPTLPRPPLVRIEGLEDDVETAIGRSVPFVVRVGNPPLELSKISTLADPDDSPANGNELLIASGLDVADAVPVTWTVPDGASGSYRLYAELTDGDDPVRSPYTPGQVRINEAPQLAFDSPSPDLAVMIGTPVVIGWAGLDPDDNATITLVLARGTDLTGNEPVIRHGIAEDDVDDRTATLETSGLQPGTYYIAGTIADRLSTVTVFSQPVVVTDRLIGRLGPSDTAFAPLSTIVGGQDNWAFGADVDCARSRNADVDDRADLLVGDPQMTSGAPGTATYDRVGIVYYYESPYGGWPATLPAEAATLQFVGEHDGADTGRRCAFVDSTLGAAEADIAIGAPNVHYGEGYMTGRAYLVDGGEMDTVIGEYTDVQLGDLEQLKLGVHWDGLDLSATGLDVAALGNVDGSGLPAFAVGATAPYGDVRIWISTVYVFLGGHVPSSGLIVSEADVVLASPVPYDLAGYAIAPIPDATGDELDELIVGAPYGMPILDPNGWDPNDYGPILDDPNDPYGSRPGVALIVFGSPLLTEGDKSAFPLGVYGPGLPDGRILVGEHHESHAGFSLATGDFDGDGRVDLVVGAPGFDDWRGRAYLLSDIGSAAWPAPPATIDLGLVGSVYPGAVFEGVTAGDELGYAAASAGDFDRDGTPDLLLGAPGANDRAGMACLVYGGPSLSGVFTLDQIGRASLPGWSFSEPTIARNGLGQRIGASLSGGDLDGDGFSDAAMGAPGEYSTSGRVYLLFGGVIAAD